MSGRLHDLKLLWRLFRYSWRYRGRLVVMLAATGAVGFFSAYLLKVGKEAVELLQAAGGGGQGIIATLGRIAALMFGIDPGRRAVDGMMRLAVILAAAAPVVAGSFYIAWTSGQWLANRCMLDLRDEFLSHLVRLEIAFHSSLSRGDLISRMTADITWFQGLFQNLFGKILQRPAAAIGTIGGLFWINWRLASVVFLVMVPVAAVLGKLLNRTRRRSRTARERFSDNIVALEQITAGIKVIKAMGSAEAECRRYGEANQRLFAANMRVARARGQTDAVTNGAIYLVTALALLIGAIALSRQWIRIPELILFLGGVGLLTNQLRGGTRTWGEIQESLPAAERVLAVLDRPTRVTDKPEAIECPPPKRAIRFEGVRFSYGEGEVLRGLDLEIPIGSTVAIVGESGAGKSTILDLIPRFRDVTGGRITIDGIDLRDLRQASLLGHFAIVQQDSFLFNDTIADNIRYGRPSATREEIVEAARRAHVHEAILALEGGLGYATVAGDRGERLSGGQRQRVAIARALLRDAPVLLMDEPTSALDADSERHVQEALGNLMRGRTSIVVAHRLSTIQHADRIYVLGPGGVGVIESGTHRELVARGGEYARLVKLQQLAGVAG